MQTIVTKDFGPIVLDKSWQNGPVHIARLFRGGYVHITGLPVKSESELRAAIPPGPELEKALEEFHNPILEPEPGKKIVINQDGSCSFEDGSPIAYADVAQMQPGPFQEAILKWLATKDHREKAEQNALASKAGTVAAQVRGKPMGRTAQGPEVTV